MEFTGPPQLEYERILVWRNPASSQANDPGHQAFYKTFIAARSIPEEHIYATSPDWRENQVKLSDNLREGDVVVLFGGDGTYNDYIQAQCDQDTPAIVRAVPVYLAGGGNGNDAARGFNPKSNRRHPSTLLDNSRVASYSPLRCTVETVERAEQTYYAASYIGFNVTGDAATMIDSQTHREDPRRKEAGHKKLLWIDGQAIWSSLAHGQEFKVENDDEIRSYYERTFANGSRMARLGSLPVRFTEPRLYEVDIKEKKVAAVVLSIGALLVHSVVPLRIIRPRGRYITEPVSFKVCDAVAWQRDGNADRLPAGSQVTISRATDYDLRVVTTRKNP